MVPGAGGAVITGGGNGPPSAIFIYNVMYKFNMFYSHSNFIFNMNFSSDSF